MIMALLDAYAATIQVNLKTIAYIYEIQDNVSTI